MRYLRGLFSDHPASVGETYGEHLRVALSFALELAKAAIVCLVHAILPFLFTRTGSAILSRLYARMVAGRHVSARPGRTADGDVILNFEI